MLETREWLYLFGMPLLVVGQIMNGGIKRPFGPDSSLSDNVAAVVFGAGLWCGLLKFQWWFALLTLFIGVPILGPVIHVGLSPLIGDRGGYAVSLGCVLLAVAFAMPKG